MRDHSNHIELAREEAVHRMLDRSGLASAVGAVGKSPLRVERVAIADAAGRVLAADVAAQFDAPNALTCAMDSIAVRFVDFEGGDMPDTSAWVRGVDWEFANTGTAMPDGFDTAIVIEHVKVSADEQHVEIDAAPSARFAGTRPVGSRMHAGDVLAHAGEVITPEVAARIAGGNAANVDVLAKPRVAFIPTGDELQVPGSSFVAHGKNLETNSIVVKMKVEAWGGEFVPLQIVPDDPAAIEAAIRQAIAVADIVVLNAGSSKGSSDWACEVEEKIGEMICHQTNHGPGHHSSYAIVDGTPVVGISGPSAGAAVTLGFYLKPLMRAALGQNPEPVLVKATLMEEMPAPHRGGAKKADAKPLKPAGENRPLEATGPKDMFFGLKPMNVSVSPEGCVEVRPVHGFWGSPAANAANSLFMMPAGGGAAQACVGDVIEVELLK